MYILPFVPISQIKDVPATFYTIKPVRYDAYNIDDLISKERNISVLPATAAWTDGEGQHTPGPFVENPVEGNRQNGLVAFPGFSFASLSDTRLGMGAVSSTLAGKLNLTSTSKYTVRFSVPFAETTGIPLRDAMVKFQCFRNTITEEELPGLKFILFQMMSKIETLKKYSQTDYSIKPGIVFITDVYYARAIDVTVTSTEGFKAAAAVTAAQFTVLNNRKTQLKAELAKLLPAERTGAETGAPKSQDGDRSVTGVATTSRVEDIQSQLALTESQLTRLSQGIMPEGLGIAGDITRATGESVTLRQTFKYPVAISYDGITYDLMGFIQHANLLNWNASGSEPLSMRHLCDTHPQVDAARNSSGTAKTAATDPLNEISKENKGRSFPGLDDKSTPLKGNGAFLKMPGVEE